MLKNDGCKSLFNKVFTIKKIKERPHLYWYCISCILRSTNIGLVVWDTLFIIQIYLLNRYWLSQVLSGKLLLRNHYSKNLI